MDKYGNEKDYNKQIINSFKHGDHPELIIVVDKLLTGFDAPRNTVLYLTKNLKEHGLLQAIARVNRLYEGKDYGYILDYYGILGDLNQALNEYKALAQLMKLSWIHFTSIPGIQFFIFYLMRFFQGWK